MGDTVDINCILELGCLSISTSSNLTPLLLFSLLDIFFLKMIIGFLQPEGKINKFLSCTTFLKYNNDLQVLVLG